MVIRLADLAGRVGADLRGDGDLEITGVNGLREARAGDLSFLANPRYRPLVAATRASAVIVARDFEGDAPCALLVADHPDAAFARASEAFARPEPPLPPEGVHPSAVVDPSATVAAGARVGPGCVVEAGAVIGEGTVLRAQVYVGHEAVVGPACLLHPQVVIREHCRLGARVILHPGVVIGSDGFGYTADDRGVRTKVPQRGIVDIGDDVEIGAGTTVDRARFGATRILRGAKIDNLVQIAHNVVIGEDAVIVAQAGIAGSTVLGSRVIMAAQSGVAGHLEVGDDSVVMARGGVIKDIPPKSQVMGFPAVPQKEAKRAMVAAARLPEMREALQDLRRRVEALEPSRG